MALFTPQSEILLLENIPFSSDYKNVVNFGSLAAQQSYFSSNIHESFEEYTFIRKDEEIKVEANIEDLYPVNYLAYKNKDKWIYCFVTNKRYINDNLTAITIKTDVYQTYLFDITMQESFIIREHVIDDMIGKNLVDEGLETGEYKVNKREKLEDFQELGFVVGYTDAQAVAGQQFGGIYGNIYSGLRYRYFAYNDTSSLTTFIANMNALGRIDGIVVIFSIPKCFLPFDVLSGADINYGSDYMSFNHDFTPNLTSLDAYTPKNKKLFTYPYTFINVSNNKGGSADFRLEDFNSDVATFICGGNLSPNPTGFCYPNNYKGVVDNWEHALTIDGFPICSWRNDVYANWLAQNSKSIITSAVLSGGAMVAGTLMANPMVFAGGVMGIANEMKSIMNHESQPAQARGNTNNGSLNSATKNNTFFFSQMEIKHEYAERIDKFFDMFGYKVNTVKVPNTNTRPFWNYVQTIDCNLKVNATMEETLELKDIFNKGVTIWHSPSNIGNYSLNNH